ncbi:MAG: hypothetical protein Q8R24_05490 [Legionellaceae bacterium]|nr:hypothetical protein [Legionellaceae bacterium]
MIIHANKLQAIPVADKPLNLGGQADETEPLSSTKGIMDILGLPIEPPVEKMKPGLITKKIVSAIESTQSHRIDKTINDDGDLDRLHQMKF